MKKHRKQIKTMKKILILSIIITFFSSTTLYAFLPKKQIKSIDDDKDFKAVIERLSLKNDILREFTQEKKISGLKMPLRSSGLMYVGKTGICMSTTNPFQASMLLSPEGVVQKSGGGLVSSRNAKDSVEIRHFVRIMMALFTADKDILEREFNVFFEKASDNWTIGLTPKGTIMSRILKSIVIEGDLDIRKVVISEASGDTTSISIVSAKGEIKLGLDNCVQ
jgi:hypothetical protein